jgi:D-3-phosphoglycerate dehydrogenase
MKVLITDKIHPIAIEILEKEGIGVDYKPGLKEEEIIAWISEYQGLVIRSATKVTAKIIEQAVNLKVIGRAGVGLDNVDLPAAKKRNIAVFNVPGGNTITTAEHTIALLLALVKNIPAADASLRAKRWDKKKFMGTEVYGKTLGIIGLGKIGRYVAQLAVGLGMKILAFDPLISEGGEFKLVDLDTLLGEADFITVHTPLNDQTKYLIAEAEFRKMKDGVRIINCARGGIIKESALISAIKEGKVKGAALDVFENEPPLENPLLDLPEVIFTPHLGAATSEAQERNAREIAQKVAEFLKS